MPTLSFGASSQRLALILHATTVDDVVEWADREIEACDKPPIELVEISMGRLLPEPNIIAYLSELITDPNDSAPMRVALGLLATKIVHEDLNPESIIPSVYQLLHNEGWINDDPFIVFWSLESDLSLIRDGILGNDRLPQLRSDIMDELWDIANPNKSA